MLLTLTVDATSQQCDSKSDFSLGKHYLHGYCQTEEFHTVWRQSQLSSIKPDMLTAESVPTRIFVLS